MVAILLEISPALHGAMVKEVQEEVRLGRLRRSRPFEPRNYFERLYTLARRGRSLSVESRELLARLGNILGITQEDFEAIRGRLHRLLAQDQVGAHASPVSVLERP
jgi:hypothetical protein